MPQIKLSYLYRDNSNYKNFGEVVFANPLQIELEEIRHSIVPNLIDGEFFIAKEWGLPELFFDDTTIDDHGWHEFNGIELVEQDSDFGDIEKLLGRISITSLQK